MQILAFIPIWSHEYEDILCMLLPGAEGEVCFEDLVFKRKPQYCGDHDQPYSTAITIAKNEKKAANGNTELKNKIKPIWIISSM